MKRRRKAFQQKPKKTRIKRDRSTIDALMKAEKLLLSGNFPGCIAACHSILKRTPEEPDALFMLGSIAVKNRQYEPAIDLLEQAIALDDSDAFYFDTLGVACIKLKRFEEAERNLRRATRLNPNLESAHSNLGCVHRERHDYDKAKICFENALRMSPSDPDAANNLAVVLMSLGQPEKAIPCFKKVLKAMPNNATTWHNLGCAHMIGGELEAAEQEFLTSLRLNPKSPKTHHRLGLLYSRRMKLTKAEKHFETSFDLEPAVDVLGGLCGVLADKANYREAIEKYQKLFNLTEAPEARIISNFLLILNYVSWLSPKEIYELHAQWGEKLGRPVIRLPQVSTSAVDVHGPLRIGYVSGDFKQHSVAYFIEPVLASHDPNRVTVYCYSNLQAPDGVTDRIRTLARHWREVYEMTDRSLAEQIRKDRIHVLVDLSGHTARNRLGVFSAKPAPIQATYLGYPNTTGIPEIDYRITDPVADPPGRTDQYSTETLERLASCFLCYKPADFAPPVGEAPVARLNRVTFGSFNNLQKANDDLKSMWAYILERVPSSRLILKAKQLSDSRFQEDLLAFFEDRGIERTRIELRPMQDTAEGHLLTYNEVDIALDTYPYNGTTTTFEAMWMGVPVITLVGNVHAARVSTSILTHFHHQELIAETQEEYCAKAIRLANDPEKIKAYRVSLRHELEKSELLDGKRMATQLEDIYAGWIRKETARVEDS